MGQREQRIKEILTSRKGRNTMTFVVFLVISAVLWIVMSLNDEAQRDVRVHVNIVNVPDSMTRITPIPENLTVSLRSRGTTLLRFIFNKRPVVNIDYRTYISGNKLKMSDIELKAYFRNLIGGGSQILSVNPDSIVVYYTSDRGSKMPVKVDAHVMPGPQYAINGKVHSLTDSVMLYSIDGLPEDLRYVSTAAITLNNVSSSQTLRVPIRVPKGVRAVPDSVSVLVEVEPLVAKSRMVDVQAVNVPEDENMILTPGQIEVYYMVPMSIYKSANSDPRFTIHADYERRNPSGKVPVRLASVPKNFVDVFLTVDSVSYILEKWKGEQ